MQFSRALAPFFKQVQDNIKNSYDAAMEAEATQYQRGRLDRAEQRQVTEDAQRDEDLKLRRVLEALKLSGRIDQGGYETLSKGGYGTMMRPSEEGDGYELVRTPEQEAELYDKALTRQLTIQQLREKAREAENRRNLPRALSKVFTGQDLPNFEQLLPIMAQYGTGNDVISLLAQASRDRMQQRNQERADRRLELAVTGQNMRQNKPPSPEEVRLQREQETMAELVPRIVDAQLAGVTTKQQALEKLKKLENGDTPLEYGSNMYNAIMREMYRRMQGMQ